MRILHVANVEHREFEAQMRARGSSVFQCSVDMAVALLTRFPGDAFADIVVLDILLESEVSPPDFETVVRLGGWIRRLPARSAMSDGRRWSSLPLVWMKRGDEFRPPVHMFPADPRADFHDIIFGRDASQGYRAIRDVTWDYYKRVAEDYTNIGYAVTEDAGRMRVETAYAPPAHTSTKYYYRPADKRNVKVFTLARNLEGDENDLSDFSDLIEPRARATEHRLHRFLADTNLMLTLDPGDVLSHPRIGTGLGRRELDFAYRPYVGRKEPQSWWVLEIKRAYPSLLADLRRGEPRLAAALLAAANQVRRYKRLIEDPRSTDAVSKALGGVPRDAKLAILIGRMPIEHRDALARLSKANIPDVSLITFDDLFDVREQSIKMRS